LLFFPFDFISAINPLDVIINEISWMGTKSSYNDEWIELYNNKNENVSPEGWILKSEDGTPQIVLTGEIIASGFYLLERTDDDTLLNVSADKIYTGTLENNGEVLKLLDDSGILIDFIDCSNGWFSGDNSSKQTMERKKPKDFGNNSENWQTSKSIGGTPKTINSQGELSPETETLKETSVEIITKTEKLKDFPSGVIINEFLPSPEGPDEQNEWIEIFNQNDFEVNLFNWEIKDVLGKTTSYIFPKETVIKAKGFLIFNRPVTKIVLNNDEDGLIMFNPNKEIIDQVSYQKAALGQSFNKIDLSWAWSDNLTPGEINSADTAHPEKPSISWTDEKVEKIELIAETPSEKTGAIIEKMPKDKKSFVVFLISLFIAFFSAIFFLLIKKSLARLRSRL